MLKRIMMLIMQGLLAFLPLSLTIYLLYFLVSTTEAMLTPLIPERLYFPGLGVASGVILLLFLGMAVNAYFVKTFIAWGGRLFEQIPIIKTIYGAIQDAVNLVNINKQEQMKSVVLVKISETIHLIGFITNQSGAKHLFQNDDKVGVYIPLSYQIGGYTLYIDKDQISYLDIDVETAMRIVLTGGSSNQ